MSETKHTPGPWTAEDESNAIIIRATSKSAHKLGQEVANICDDELNDLTPTMWADARLIAAAPNLYEACRQFIHWYSENSTEAKRDDAYEAAINAIAVAEGKE